MNKQEYLVTHFEFLWQHILFLRISLWFSCWTTWKADISHGAWRRKKAQTQIQKEGSDAEGRQVSLPSRLYSPTNSTALGVFIMNTWIHSEYRCGVPVSQENDNSKAIVERLQILEQDYLLWQKLHAFCKVVPGCYWGLVAVLLNASANVAALHELIFSDLPHYKVRCV